MSKIYEEALKTVFECFDPKIPRSADEVIDQLEKQEEIARLESCLTPLRDFFEYLANHGYLSKIHDKFTLTQKGSNKLLEARTACSFS